MFKFEKVKRFENVEIAKPIRKTNNSACYDMVAAEDTIIMPATELLYKLGNSTDDVDRVHSIEEVSALTKKTGCKPTLISTGYKAYMDKGYSLDLYVRSSSPLKYWLMLANSTGVIDADYVDNPDNEGEIFFQVFSLLPFPIKIKKGEIIGQAKFVKYQVTDDDDKQEKQERLGGFGSTGTGDVIN